MDTTTLNTKIEICEAAVELYQQDHYTLPALVDKTGKTASEIYALFPGKKAILEFYYTSLIIRYRAMINEIEDFESYSISEKLSNFAYTLFDMMGEQQAFVEQTFDKLVLNPAKSHKLKSEVKELFREFFTADDQVSLSASMVMGDLFFGFLRTQYFCLIRFWLQDDSEGKERSWALTDKIAAFTEELVYSKIADKGFDIFKYMLNTSGFDQKIKDLNAWFSHWSDMDAKNKEPEHE